MYSNPYINYYANQAGTGIGGFQGARFQKGHGFFGNVFKSAILPLLKYLGPKAVALGSDVASDAISGVDILNSLQSRGKSALRSVASDAGERAIKFAQTGKGRRIKRAQPKSRVIKKKPKKSKRVIKKKTSVFD